MSKLEKALDNLGRGAVTGLASIIDPIGNVFSGIDYAFTGVGPSDKRALDTVYNNLYKGVYPDPEEKVDFGTGYLPRFLGRLGGIGLGGIGLLALYKSFGWVAAAAVPFATGIYSAFNSVKKYIQDFGKGEKIGDKNEKARFYDGFKYGWSRGTHLFIDDLHYLETAYTGRSIYESGLESSMKKHSANARRNFSSVLGTVAGGITGGIVSLLTLGLLPLYNSVRDTVKTFEKNKKDEFALNPA